MGFCDRETGRCDTSDLPQERITASSSTPQAQVLFVTDPVCSHCWGLEPVWRRFLHAYGSALAVRYIYGGLLPSWKGFSRGGISSPADLVPHFAEVAEQYGQPIDSSIWVQDPPDSSYPASIALHIVREIFPQREESYLRRIRQALFLESRNIANADVLAECARDIGLNYAQFLDLLKQGHGKIAFQQDLQETQNLHVRGFPTLFIQGKDSQTVIVRGGQSFEQLEQALLSVTTLEQTHAHSPLQDILRAYGSGTTREFSEVLELEREQTVEVLTIAHMQSTALAGDLLWSIL